MSKTRCPTHPGRILREDSLPALNMSVAAFARALGVSRQMVHGILSERSSVSPEMALRLGAFFVTARNCGSTCRCATTCGRRNGVWPAICRRATRNKPRRSQSARDGDMHREGSFRLESSQARVGENASGEPSR